MEINENIIKEFTERKIDLNKFLSYELVKIKTNEDKIQEVKSLHIKNKIQHEKFIELWRKGNEVGVDIFCELFREIISPKNKNSFPILMGRISNLSKKYAAKFNYYKSIEECDMEDEFYGETNNQLIPNVSLLKGYLSEIFYECFCKILETDEDFPFYSYIPNNSNDDNGVDGFAISKYDNRLTTVQEKYKTLFVKPKGVPKKTELLERDIKQFPWQSVVKYGVPLETFGNMVVITNCDGLHRHTDNEVYMNSLLTLNGNFIQNKINNFVFWDLLSKMVFDTLNYELSQVEKNNLILINTLKQQ